MITDAVLVIYEGKLPSPFPALRLRPGVYYLPAIDMGLWNLIAVHCKFYDIFVNGRRLSDASYWKMWEKIHSMDGAIVRDGAIVGCRHFSIIELIEKFAK